MSKLSKSPPLKAIRKNQISRVSTYPDEPVLFRRKDTKQNIAPQELALLKQLAQMELVLEKIHRLDIWKSKLDVSSKLVNGLHQTVQRLQMDIQSSKYTLAETTIKQLYPRASRLLFDLKETPSSSNHKWLPLQHLDQLYVTASRLYHDLNGLENLKFIAYQLALLYQCVNRQGVTFVSYKVRIEQRFDEIKLATKKEPVHLDADQKSWLRILALDIIAQATHKSTTLKCGHIFDAMQQITA
ncbi:hypothetical protein BD408DRAFT_422529 [Parasitella parasitica]|nr:hypothetical protein BD408DRAFT_422529 [Parasitella parasitica]